MGVALLLLGSVATSVPADEKKSLKEMLLNGSPWLVNFANGPFKGRFNQSFADNGDGTLKATSDEVGPYETTVTFSADGKTATWRSPHSRVITIRMQFGEPYGEGGGVQLWWESKKK